MLIIKFGKWNHKAGRVFCYDRIYRQGYKWTPFCILRFRCMENSRRANRWCRKV